jgi:cysteinyl-tRNA synthetase
MANYWLHNGFINLDGEKMSKSLGNITIMNELLAHHNPVSIKYAILTTHYRQPIDFSNDLLKYSSNIVLKWRDFVKKSSNDHLDQDFLKALEDDLNTPQALMRLQQIFNDLKKTPEDKELSNYFNNGLSILGLVPHFQEIELNLDNDDIENMIARRADAKSSKNFELADQIREELLDNGIILEDTKSGTKWKKA